MAGGKLTPRQKMINMMYLVLTAMLALNVSQEILRALTEINDSMEATVSTVDRGNEVLYTSLANEAKENKRAEEWNERAQQLKPIAQSTWQLIEDVKREMIEKTGGRAEDGMFKGSDDRDTPTNVMLNSKDIGGGGKAKEIREALERYKAFLLENAGNDAAMIASIEQKFNFDPVKVEGEDTPKQWEERKFAELPLAGVITNLTEIQSNVRRAESDMLEEFMQGIDMGTVKFTTVRPFIDAKSNYITQGDQFEAEIFLAAYDDSQNPTFTLNGQEIAAEDIEAGRARVVLPGTGVGEKTFSGSILLPGADSAITFEGSYIVAPPTAVISPTKMNVLYRQVKNPLEISVPGVQPENLVVNGPGVRQKSPGVYEADVTTLNQREITISVGVREDDGTVRSVGSRPFRIKGLPKAEARIYRRSTPGPYSASAIASAPIEAAYPDFAFDLELEVTKFEVIVPGSAPFRINGNRMTSNARAAIEAARTGSTIIIRNVEAVIKGTNNKVTNVASLPLDLN
ncbi:type IX secretion system motor protein PorM/GldM [Phaeocystidibacter luteus]|uniref:Gliding motility protein GldM n=1 Tax=Phaeocystidibacter luteus TaxID=911197 RepID=A0A6N6RJ97_9FLAO|nr:gliding motility protein GldM [Phaeocystidibacter luteus]KAB2813678.1 gliding motility protein GldM [Phaeocystidibacter luteus]